MDLNRLAEVWEDFLNFLDRSFQWLMYIFGAIDEWPPADYPDIDE